MSTTAEEIDRWRLSSRENQRFEFKEAKAQFDTRKLLEYCVALANEGGGHLVLGVADAHPHLVVGTRAFADLVRWLNGSSRPLAFASMSRKCCTRRGVCWCFTPRPARVGRRTTSEAGT